MSLQNKYMRFISNEKIDVPITNERRWNEQTNITNAVVYIKDTKTILSIHYLELK